MKISINNPAKKATDHTCSVVFLFLKWMSKKNIKVVGPFFVNIYYDKRRKVVCY